MLPGGNQKTSFYVSGAFRDEEGIVQRTGFKRRNIKANIFHKFSNFLDIQLTTSFINSEASRSFTGNENEGGLSYGYTLALTRPWNNLFPDEDGNYPDNPNYPGNPLFVRDFTRNNETSWRTISSFTTNLNFINTESNLLRFTFTGGVDFIYLETDVFVPREHQAQRGADNGYVAQGANQLLNTNFQGILLYNTQAGDFDLTSQAGFTRIRNERDFQLSRTTQLPVGPPNLGDGTKDTDQTIQEEEDFGLFLQQEVNWKDRVILTAGVRLDKSTLNGDQNNFYAFPKASLAINLAEFDFLSGSTAISLFKFRGAFGQTGSSAIFGRTFTSLGSGLILGNSSIGIGTRRGNPDIEPERATEIEAGLDMSFFNNRVGFELTYYNRQVKDLILERALPASSGFNFEAGNFADLRNQGIELAINALPVSQPKISWSTGLNFWFNRSEITRLDVPAFAPPGSAFGLSLGTFFIEQDQPVTQIVGNVDGTPTQIGDVEPDFQLGWNNTVNFLNGFELRFLWHWKQGGEVINLSRFLTDIGGVTPDLNTQEGMDRRNGVGGVTRFIEDGTYIRLREVALYYTLPKDFVKSTFNNFVKNIRIGVSGYNLLTITDYSWYDPEVSTKGGTGLSSGLDVTPFPSSKKVYFHLNIGF